MAKRYLQLPPTALQQSVRLPAGVVLEGGHMRRRDFIRLAGIAVAALPIGAIAQQPRSRTARVGVLSPFMASGPPSPAYDVFTQTLRELGWVEGQNVSFEYRWADGHTDQLPRLASELAQSKVDVIFSAWGTPAALAAKATSTTIPVVFAGVGDAIGVGLVASLAQPGGNITGSTFQAEATVFKELQLLRETVPQLSLVGFFINPTNPVYGGDLVKHAEAAAQSLNLGFSELRAEQADDLDSGFKFAKQNGVDGVIVFRDPVFLMNASRLVKLAETYRMPTLYGLSEFVVAGGLMSHGPNLRDLYRRAAYIIDKVLAGAKPNDVPVEQSTKFETVINLRAAKAIGIEIPTSMLLRADEVIE
jgi:putative ABC transport system substrate-binding protein